MNSISFDNILKILFYVLIPLSLVFLYQSFYSLNQSKLNEEKVFNISFDNQTISRNFLTLFENTVEENVSSEEISFQDLGIELAGIVSINKQPNRGYIILNFINEENFSNRGSWFHWGSFSSQTFKKKFSSNGC